MIGLLTGTGLGSIPGLADARDELRETPFGAVTLRRGRLAGEEVAHIGRHGPGHERLSSHVEHRANVAALHAAGARAVLATTVCGGLDPASPPGSVLVFDDLHFPANRLPDGSLCSFFAPGEPGRGHWIFDRPFAAAPRAALLAAAPGARDGGCYGHVDGPRFNTRSEIAALAAAGVTAVSQTAGPETVLCGELELPYALVGFVTDWANGAAAEPTPLDELTRLLAEGARTLAELLAGAVARLAGAAPGPAGSVYRLGG